MKKIIFISLLIAFISLCNAEDKYLVYFVDKGISKSELNNNPTKFFKQAADLLSERAIERRKKVSGDKIIHFEDIPINKNYIDKIIALGLKIHHELKWFNAVSLYAEKSDLDKIRKLSFVDRIEKVKSFYVREGLVLEKEDKLFSDKISYTYNYGNSLAQSELHDIPIVHDAGFSGRDVIIGFLDSGYNWKEHPALKNLNVIYEYDYVFNDSVTKNESEDVPGQDAHGTAVFSIAAGFEEERLIGPAFNSTFLLAKTENIASERRVEEDNFVAAVEDFEQLGADIITASLGYSIFDDSTESYTYQDMDGKTTLVAQAYNFAFERGVVTIAAAGNEGNNDWRYIISPADAFNTIAVGNSTISGNLNSSSSRGPTSDGRIKPDVIAMGTSNFHASSFSGGYSNSGSGTSFAAPMVAGMAAQLLSAFPYLSNEQVRRIIQRSGNNYDDPNNSIGYGLMSVKRAMNEPNFSETNGIYRISKMFIGSEVDGLKNVEIHYQKDGGELKTVSLPRSNLNIYILELPSDFEEGDNVSFYYTYRSRANELIIEPENGKYNLTLSEQPDDKPDEDLPTTFEVEQNYPNPFNNLTRFVIKSSIAGEGSVVVYNSLGQKVVELYRGSFVPGLKVLTWDGTNYSGSRVASGPYFYQVILNKLIQTKKMMLIK